MLKQVLLFFAIILLPQVNFSQDDKMPNSVDEVIKWNFSVTYESACDATIHMTVDQLDHWHVYTQKQPAGSVAYPTEFTFTKSSDFDLVGGVTESGASNGGDPKFPEKAFYGEKARFKQKIKLNSTKNFTIKLEYGYMACKTACFAPEFRDVEIKCNGRSGECVAEVVESGTEPVSDTTASDLIDSPIGFQTFATYSSATEEWTVAPISIKTFTTS